MTSTAPTQLSNASSSAIQASGTGAPPSAAALAQMVDCAAQEFGLTSASRQQLYLLAIQSSPSLSELWIHAAVLRNASQIKILANRITAMDSRFNTLTSLVHQDYHLGKQQEKMIKKLMQYFLMTTKASYESGFIFHHPSQFSLELYPQDDTVEGVLNGFVDREIHQCRSSFRKILFIEAAGDRLLAQASGWICCVFAPGIKKPTPKYVQAHIAQLRLIAHGIIAPRCFQCPRHDTSFWTAVNARFDELRRLHRPQYDGNAGWELWEDEVIAADQALFTGKIQFPGEVPMTFMDQD
ncbi:hypothetical protein FRC08_000524 [Ceratobasidium sp. 394]|nr:hypothetical protein FRC08_000524 [Ceratobasidium sp. 394]